jgi:hypothetical protein
MRSAWTRRCSGFFDRHESPPHTRCARAKALPNFGNLEGKDFGTSASSSLIHLGVNFVHGFSMSSPVVSHDYWPKRRVLHSPSLMVFQTVVVALMNRDGSSPWFLYVAPWGHRSPRDRHAGKWKSAGDSFSMAFCSCFSPLTCPTSVVLPSHLKPNGHDGAIWTSSAMFAGIACLQMHSLVRC